MRGGNNWRRTVIFSGIKVKLFPAHKNKESYNLAARAQTLNVSAYSQRYRCYDLVIMVIET